MDIRPEVLGQSTRDTETVTHPTIQGNATTARELGEGFRKESPRLSVREYVKFGNVELSPNKPDRRGEF